MRLLSFFVVFVALILGVLLFGSTISRLARASYLYATDKVPNGATGRFTVGAITLRLEGADPQERAITAELWYPSRLNTPVQRNQSEEACGKRIGSLPLAEASTPFSLVLYVPGMGGSRTENRVTAEFLASQGYLILAFDDGIVSSKPEDGYKAQFPFDFSSEKNLARTIRLGAEKTSRDAQTTLTALDRFTQCAEPEWKGKVTFDRVGFLGYSIGGSIASHAGLIDPRVISMVNMDGWLFGPTADGQIHKPYLYLMSDDVDVHTGALQKALASDDPSTHYEAELNIQGVQMLAPLVNRAGNYGFWFRGTTHQSFNDNNFHREQVRSWLKVDAYTVQAAKDAYIKAFFDTTLKGLPASALLTENPSPYPNIEVLKDSSQWGEGMATAPTQAELGSK